MCIRNSNLYNLEQIFFFYLQIKRINTNLADLTSEDVKQKTKEFNITRTMMIIVSLFVVCNVFQVLYYAYTYKGTVFWEDVK